MTARFRPVATSPSRTITADGLAASAPERYAKIAEVSRRIVDPAGTAASSEA
jgi:hypothetical protein